MSTDTQGYITGIPWSYDYHYFLCPHYVRFAMGLAGLDMPLPQRVCELAYGNGVSLLIHAAGNVGINWTGTDFNAGHAAFARRLADGNLANLTLDDLSFADYFRRLGQAEFDLITMTGTWSWLADAERARIIGFAAGALSPGGAFCHDHMVLPGHFAETAFRRLLISFLGDRPPHDEAEMGNIGNAIERAIAFFDTNPAFLSLYPTARQSLEAMRDRSASSLAHEYFNYNWNPSYFADTAALMKSAGLQWGCSWKLLDHCDSLHLTNRQQAQLSDARDLEHAEFLKDYMRLKSMRYDIWVRDGQRCGKPVRDRVLHDSRLVLVRPPSTFTNRLEATLGEFQLSDKICREAFGKLGGPGPVTAADLDCDEMVATMLTIALLELGIVQIAANSGAEIESARRPCQQLNDKFMKLAGTASEVHHLASPVTGAGVPVPVTHQIFLGGCIEGCRTPSELAGFAAARLGDSRSAGGRQAGSSGDKHLAPESFRGEAAEFLESYLPVYRSLLIAD